MERNKIYHGNNIDILRTFPDNSIDSIVTDPPYGLGKEPDALEVLQSWITTGYHEIKGKGFMGKEWDSFVPQPVFWKECLRVLKPGGHLLSFAGTRTYDWVVMGLRIAGFEIRDQIAWVYGSGFPKSHDISKAIDKKLGVERKIIGKAKGVGSNNTNSMKNGLGESQEFASEYDITSPSTNQAKQWQGWGTALKPALEPIVMARKPLDGTVANNVLKHGVGGINIDGCRVGEREEEQFTGTKKPKSESGTICYGDYNYEKSDIPLPSGRFPANFIHDGSDEVVSLFPDTNGSSIRNPSGGTILNPNDGWNGNSMVDNTIRGYDDNGGSAARFFYTPKASQNERNFGLGGFEDGVVNDGRKAISDRPYLRNQTQRKNIHPTVKPIDLMQYLVRLVTPKGGICLDPFMGSGTTAIACKSEKIDYVGCELEEDYIKIAEARIKAEVVQFDIFDFMED